MRLIDCQQLEKGLKTSQTYETGSSEMRWHQAMPASLQIACRYRNVGTGTEL